MGTAARQTTGAEHRWRSDCIIHVKSRRPSRIFKACMDSINFLRIIRFRFVFVFCACSHVKSNIEITMPKPDRTQTSLFGITIIVHVASVNDVHAPLLHHKGAWMRRFYIPKRWWCLMCIARGIYTTLTWRQLKFDLFSDILAAS